jgi:hypothetical protein
MTTDQYKNDKILSGEKANESLDLLHGQVFFNDSNLPVKKQIGTQKNGV